jgi:hypothetical protein
VVLRVAGAAPAESQANPDYYDDDDEFVPASEKENFDAFDWQLCKVRGGGAAVYINTFGSRLSLFIIVLLFLLRLLIFLSLFHLLLISILHFLALFNHLVISFYSVFRSSLLFVSFLSSFTYC